ncbi:hypothetical protein AVEN_77665-1 [Araneus ventricosus]|uniref:Uncharacterized protein n=1 Tax=Araneus ventricosus TaxID=182803 RepID=A0A4Y2UQW4_ARAVE|nr:hypothetical protein AVEN_13629-1 [Araneus ventricosus]GBO13955.1 hypothetical protein AVEN_77665-1 [Araneus ventricosus]
MLQHLQLVWMPLVSRKLRMAHLWLIPSCAERCRVPFVGLLAVADGTCVDVLSAVGVFSLPDPLASMKEPDLLNFISFATVSGCICVLCFALIVLAT